MPESPIGADELISLGRELIERAGQFESLIVLSGRIVNAAHLPTVAALTTHAHRLGAVVLDLYEHGLRSEAMPTIRSLYECSLTAAWLSQSKEGLPAFVNEELRWRGNLANDASAATSAVFRAGAEKMRQNLDPAWETSAERTARSFRARCEALSPAGIDAYVPYRFLSAYTHPSTTLADHYVVPADNPAGAAIRQEPKPLEHDSWLFVTVASMVWAARALDVMLVDHPNRSYLRSVARTLQIHDVLDLSPAERTREEVAMQRRRRARWKSPRRRTGK